jgi:hypothetical protein
MAKIYTSDLIGKRQDIVDEIMLLNPYQIPLISALGITGGEVVNTIHEWYEDQLFDTKSTVSVAASNSDTTITVASVEAFRSNQVVKIGDELILITAVNTSTKVLTVTRGYGSTTATAIAQGATIEVMFVLGEEGADARESRYKPRVTVQNVTQIFDDSIKVTGTAEAVQQYGIDDLYESEKQKKQLELALQLEKAIINGIKYNDTGTTRMMKGIRSFITTNVIDAASATLTIDMINDAAQAIYSIGGFKEGGNYNILVPAKQKRVLSKLLADKIALTRQDTTRGQVVTNILTDFGEFGVTLSDNLKPDEIILTDMNRMKIMPLRTRGFAHTFMGKTGDSTVGQIVGEYTLEFRQEKAHARIKGLA